jgi:hypothetical protein
MAANWKRRHARPMRLTDPNPLTTGDEMLSRSRLIVTHVLSALAFMAAFGSAVVLFRSPLGPSADRIAEVIRSQGGTNVFGSDLIELSAQ